MNEQLSDLYQELVLEHKRKPHNFRKMGTADKKIEGYNPLCGDRITLYVKLDGDKITDVAFQGAGCAISTASASMMTDAVKGKKPEEAEALFETFHNMVTSEPGSPVNADDLGDLEILAHVREFPNRVKCASLSWHALKAALKGRQASVSTE